MPNNRKSTMKKIGGKDGIHPGSRKAGQITRVHLRNAKLASAAKGRKGLNQMKLFRPLFFLHSLSGPGALSLTSLRALISDVFLTRNDDRIAELTAERRPGRPKDKELLELEELRRREHAEWETGFEVPNLTDGATTRLMYSWVESDTNLQSSHCDLLPWVRLFANDETTVVVSRAGKLGKMGLGEGVEGEGDDWAALAKEGEGEGEIEVEA
ncbi:translation machinery-associated protein 16 [Vanrija albida]|uniref:Translation machinery-associated protein 16 n=1 Tax=Vanrija albida TaxID=181172 RepID=A0ABR3Q0Y4_9TREE